MNQIFRYTPQASLWLLLCLLLPAISLTAQKTTDVYVDKNGVMRWGKTHAEVYGFGVNYTVPFAHAYRVAKQLNVPHEKAIDADIYHFARLGFDAYRVHVWDTEISDTLGNLLENEHLKLFDYTLQQMKERGIKFIITPIAYWGNGWPEPDEKTPGFSAKYGKAACLTDPGAIQAQETYLYQFLNHVNVYTGIAYKDDPDIIAFEISNEPHHGGEPAEVTGFINRMVQSMRKTGCRKPIFYNISHSIHLADAYFDADIQGGTFQWYPTGLGANRELQGNLLPNVDKYAIPFADKPKFKQMAKIVYEFDAADVGRSYIYPAMARSFREAGLQVATHFAYDPTYMAHANTEYGTHYMNLAYAPQKALSLKIASEVFHRVPLYKSYGSYPANASFDAFRVDYEQDLAEMVTPTAFIYTNTTRSAPPAPAKLEQVAGSGNSSIVSYEGTGAYFLDRLEKGVWRLEVMPDAIWVRDPFERYSLKKEVAVINWRKWPISIQLPDLGENYSIQALNEGNTFTGQADGNSFTVSPGTYLLVKNNARTKLTGNSRWKNIILNEFSAPATTLTQTYVLHEPHGEISAGQSLPVKATVVSVKEPDVVELHVFGTGFRPEIIPMKKEKGYTYSATIPEKFTSEGFLRYHITVKEKDSYHTYPSGLAGRPGDWDFYDQNPYQVGAVVPKAPLYLFDALTDAGKIVAPWNRDTRLVPLADPGKAELQVNVARLFTPDPENKAGTKQYDYSFRYAFGPAIQGYSQDLARFRKLVFSGRSITDKACPVQLALIMKDGSAYGGMLTLDIQSGEYALSLDQLQQVPQVILPRPYPSFLPYFFKNQSANKLDLNAIESLQVSIGPGIAETEREKPHGIAVTSVRLEE